VQLARDLKVGKVIVPPLCSNLSALGLLVADTQHDYVRTVAKKEDHIDPAELTDAFNTLEKQGLEDLRRERIAEEDIVIQRSADLRYQGQSYEINTPVPSTPVFVKADIDQTVKRFHELHQKLYSYCEPHDTVEFVNVRVRAIGKTKTIDFSSSVSSEGDAMAALKGTRRVYFEGEGFVETPIYERDLMIPGTAVDGPVIVEEPMSSTLVPLGARATIDKYGNIVVVVEGEES